MNSRIALARAWQLPVAAVFATMTSAIGLGRLIHPSSWVGVLLLFALVIAGTGILLRAVNAARPLVVPGQVAVVVLLLTVMFIAGMSTLCAYSLYAGMLAIMFETMSPFR